MAAADRGLHGRDGLVSDPQDSHAGQRVQRLREVTVVGGEARGDEDDVDRHGEP